VIVRDGTANFEADANEQGQIPCNDGLAKQEKTENEIAISS
jgi:hypothetical protein